MAEKDAFYKCNICGNVVSVQEQGGGELICCDYPMNKFEEKTQDEGKEKHIPVLETTEKGVKVQVGSVLHPMEDKHYIVCIQILKNNAVLLEKQLKPGDQPVAEFCIENKEGLTARAYCNVHGLWKN